MLEWQFVRHSAAWQTPWKHKTGQIAQAEATQPIPFLSTLSEGEQREFAEEGEW
jgi:hypothetical protein